MAFSGTGFADQPATRSELTDTLLRSPAARRADLSDISPTDTEFAILAAMMFAGVNAGADETCRQVERELRAITLSIVGLPSDTRCLFTSSGSESILLALHAAREVASIPGGQRAAIVAPDTIHPAVAKAARIIGADLILADVGANGRATAEPFRGAIRPGVFAAAASAPAWAAGGWDDLSGIAVFCAEHGLHMHADACIGGLLAPFLPASPISVPPPAASISLDWHKFGYAPMHLSALCIPDPRASAIRFPAGANPPAAGDTLAGDRPFAPIAAAWATARLLGRSGYRRFGQLMEARRDELLARANASGFQAVAAPSSPIIRLLAGNGVIEAADARLERIRAKRQRLSSSLRLRIDPLMDERTFAALLDCIGPP
ncbi:MAG: aminotransferase class V-fold PLP-dependent enzyme [Hyphomonadaceae bacterium]|nr:aminotransferase class V-fold PLP-dependent enzyme [Hyphomonadaceae bacterium]